MQQKWQKNRKKKNTSSTTQQIDRQTNTYLCIQTTFNWRKIEGRTYALSDCQNNENYIETFVINIQCRMNFFLKLILIKKKIKFLKKEAAWVK